MLLTHTEETIRFVGDSIEAALADPGRDATRCGQERLRVGLVDPDCVIIVDCGSGEVHLERSREAGVTGLVAMTAEVAVSLCNGDIDPADAMAAGRIVVDGSGGVLLDLLAERRFAPAG